MGKRLTRNFQDDFFLFLLSFKNTFENRVSTLYIIMYLNMFNVYSTYIILVKSCFRHVRVYKYNI